MFQKIRDFLTPPVFEDHDRTRIAGHIYLLAKIALWTIPVVFISMLILVGTFSERLFILPGVFLIAIIPIALVRTGHVRLAGTFYTILLWIFINYSTITTGGVRAVGFGGNLGVLVAAAILINLRALFLFGGATIALGLILAVLQTEGVLPPVDANVSAYTSWVTHVGFITMNAGLLYIALDNIQRALRRSRNAEKEVRELNRDLTLAYDTTLEGWAKALELKDKETEGHSRRVIDLTQTLAIELGIIESELKHIHYGALLHDIGKMATPDKILNKPGPLTPEEQKIIEAHPVTAFNLLRDIKYLQKAIEIPYCHHEKWDGSGYPLGLKGEQIPLSARIFAVVDVWDALNSDRPYRDAWPSEEVFAYMRNQSGKHFDPKVLDVFLEKVGSGSSE